MPVSLKFSSVIMCVVCVPQETVGNVVQTRAAGELYSRKTLFVDLFQHDVMSEPLSSHLIIALLNEAPQTRPPHYQRYNNGPTRQQHLLTSSKQTSVTYSIHLEILDHSSGGCGRRITC